MLLRSFESFEKTENGYLIHGDAADVKLIFMTDDIIRVRVHFDKGTPMEEESYTLVTTAWPDRMDDLLKDERTRITALDVPCTEDEKCLTFETAHVTLKLFKKPFHFEMYDKEGKLLYQDLRERAFEKDQIGRLTHFSKVDREYDHFFGFGEKTGHLDKKGRRLRMSPKDAIGHDPETGDPMYKHIPFYIRVNEKDRRPIGLFYHNSYDCVFDLGEELSGYWERYCYYQTDGGDIDLFLLAGPTLPDILNEYTLLTGRSALPTKQSLGYCASTMYYAELEKNCDEEIYKVIDKHEKEGILIDNFWLASGYSSGEEDNLRYVFNWNHKRFPDPKKFFENMNARGINVIPNLKPGILKRHPYIDLFEKNDVFIKTPDGKAPYYGRWWGGEGRFFDFTGPKGRDTWKQLLEENILKKANQKRHLSQLSLEEGRFTTQSFVQEMSISDIIGALPEENQAEEINGSSFGKLSASEIQKTMDAVEDATDVVAAQQAEAEAKAEEVEAEAMEEEEATPTTPSAEGVNKEYEQSIKRAADEAKMELKAWAGKNSGHLAALEKSLPTIQQRSIRYKEACEPIPEVTPEALKAELQGLEEEEKEWEEEQVEAMREAEEEIRRKDNDPTLLETTGVGSYAEMKRFYLNCRRDVEGKIRRAERLGRIGL